MKKKNRANLYIFMGLLVLWGVAVYIRSLFFRPYEVGWFVGVLFGGVIMFGAGYEFCIWKVRNHGPRNR